MQRVKNIFGVATTIRREGNKEIIRYHQTDICTVEYGDADSKYNTMTITTGGHWTKSTKERINQCFEKYGINARLYQHRYTWFVELKVDGESRHLEFHNGMQLDFA